MTKKKTVPKIKAESLINEISEDVINRGKSNACRITLIEDALKNHWQRMDAQCSRIEQLQYRIEKLEARPQSGTTFYWTPPVAKPSIWTKIKRWFI